jgi:predicted DNA-binding transcriptional regulator AlpA
MSKKSVDEALGSSTVRHFDELPGSALVDVKVVAAVRGISIPTAWRHVRKGILPAPQKNGGCTRWLVRDLRAAA